MADGEIFPFLAAWLSIPGMVEYDPAIHGYRKEVAHALGLEEPVASAPAVVIEEPKSYVAGAEIVPAIAVTEPVVAQGQPTEPDLSDVFAPE